MDTALIGHSGFVGSNLLKQGNYNSLYRSSDIDQIRGKSFDHVVCAGVQAKKWWANLHPDQDRQGIERLKHSLAEIRAERFTLISTIDVYPSPESVHEDTWIDRAHHHAYGLHRLELEDWVRDQFSSALILRLPGLFGPGLKKNVIYDMLHGNNLDKVHPDGTYQYYDLKHLGQDIVRAWDLGLQLLNVSSEPLRTGEIRDRFFPLVEIGETASAPGGYNMLSNHHASWGGRNGYLYTKDRVIEDLRVWLEVEKDNNK